MLNSIKGFTVETTNICTLKCPKCARTELIEKFPGKWKNKQLNLEHFKNFLDIDLNGLISVICGDYGDAIYYDKLIEMVAWLKQSGTTISLHTNGSYKTKDWWDELVSHMDANDRIVFAIDGLPNTFTTYRINADWNSIKVGIDACRDNVTMVWQFIPFSFNEADMDKVEQFSKDLGFNEFLVINSSRWSDKNDEFRPINPNEQEITWYNNRERAVSPRCKTTNLDHFITASGYYAPCCHVPNHNFYYKTNFYKNRNLYDISKTTISKILESQETIKFFNNIETSKPNVCTYKCPEL